MREAAECISIPQLTGTKSVVIYVGCCSTSLKINFQRDNKAGQKATKRISVLVFMILSLFARLFVCFAFTTLVLCLKRVFFSPEYALQGSSNMTAGKKDDFFMPLNLCIFSRL